MNRTASILALALCLGTFADASAQSGAFSERTVTRSQIIDALLPCPPGAKCKDWAPSRTRPSRDSAPVTLTFETGSAELTSGAKRALDTVASGILSDELAKYRFTIEGHADPRGGDDVNASLSRARADAVRNYLVAQHGIDATRLSPVGLGSSQLANERDPTDPLNRRVTFVTIVR